jgi:uncharacterized protein (DUF305 family)
VLGKTTPADSPARLSEQTLREFVKMKWVVLMTAMWTNAAYAQQAGNMPSIAAPAPPAAHHIPGMSFAPSDAASQADRAAMDKMMAAMIAPYTGDADYDFVTHMIPHHQGAVDMCETELQHGQDAGLKRLCQRIVTGQQAEIRLMQAWLAKHPSKIGSKLPPNIQWK